MKGSIFKAEDRGWEFDNLQLLAALPSSKANVSYPCSYLHMPEHWFVRTWHEPEFLSGVHRLPALPVHWLEASRSTDEHLTLLTYRRLYWPVGIGSNAQAA